MKQFLFQLVFFCLLWTATGAANDGFTTAFESVLDRLAKMEVVVGELRDENKQLKSTLDEQQDTIAEQQLRVIELERRLAEHVASYTQDSKRDRIRTIKHHTSNLAGSDKRNAAAPAMNAGSERKLEEAKCSEPGGARLFVDGVCSCMKDLLIGNRSVSKELNDTKLSITHLQTRPQQLQFIGANGTYSEQDAHIKICLGLAPCQNWQSYEQSAFDDAVFQDINITACNFSATPTIFTSLSGRSGHFTAMGVTSIYIESTTQFRVYLFSESSIVNAQYYAEEYDWSLNWLALGV